MNQKEIQIIEAKLGQTFVNVLGDRLLRMKRVPAFACNEQVLAPQLPVRFGDGLADRSAYVVLIIVAIGAVKVSVA